ncbi:T9SS type A sorting domain-containing protein [Ignavibacterium sp.]|uniref:T9SS type A sorting domain-containing protein n=1 Tax=Ignavibacterium sp. TaxID=2651167 RepID=UPI00307DD68F
MMRKQTLLLVLVFQVFAYSQLTNFITEYGFEKIIAENNQGRINSNILFQKLLEINSSDEKINEFILSKYFNAEDFYLQSGYTKQNWDNSSWVNNLRFSIEFSPTGNEQSSLYENWNGNIWEPDKKYESIYNQVGKITTYTYFIYLAGQWQPQNKIEYVYSLSGNSDTLTNYNYLNSQWEINYREIKNYNANSNLIEKIRQVWISNNWINEIQNLYLYDGNNNLISLTNKYWDNGIWVNNNQYLFTYNQHNNYTEYLYQKWINSNWVNQFRYTYSYNQNNLLDVYLKQNWINNNWVNADRSTYNYDNLGNRIQTTRQLWDGSNWQYYQQTTYTYSDTLLVHYLLSQYSGNQFINVNQTSISYDNNNNKQIEVYQNWVNGIWQNSNKFIFTHTLITNAESEMSFTDNFYLEQNYPNPFNPTTKIKYTIPDVGSGLALTVLKVYDILGNEVATLVNDYKPAGSYEVEFNASNLSSGTYFYKLSAGKFTATQKLILIK